MSYFRKEEAGALVPVGELLPDEEGAIYAIERASDDAIIARMTLGTVVEQFVYSYPIKTKQGTKEIIGISSDGAKEMAMLRGNIEILPDVKLEERGDYIYSMLRGRDLIRNVTLIGVGRQCKYIVDEGNKPTDRIDETSYVKSISKSQRNCILALVPQEVQIGIIQRFMEMNKTKKLPPAVPMKKPAPATTAEAKTETKAQTPVEPKAEVKPPPADVTPPAPTEVKAEDTPELIRLRKDVVKLIMSSDIPRDKGRAFVALHTGRSNTKECNTAEIETIKYATEMYIKCGDLFKQAGLDAKSKGEYLKKNFEKEFLYDLSIINFMALSKQLEEIAGALKEQQSGLEEF